MRKIPSISLVFLFLITAGAFAQLPQKVEKNGFVGLQNAKGKLIIPLEYDNILEPVNGIYAAKNKKGLWGFFTEEKKISDCLYDNFRIVSSTIILIQLKGRWGALRSDGTMDVAPIYKYLNQLSANHYKAGEYNQWCIRSFQNEVINTYWYDSVYYCGENVYRFCLAGRYGLMDHEDTIITTDFQNMYESTLYRKLPKKDFSPKTVVAYTGFRVPFQERFDTVYHFSEGFAKFQSNRKYGFVDSLGNIRLVPQYTLARDFSEGMVAVMLMGKWGFMDKHETLCVQPYYDEVTDFKNGVSVVRRDKQYNFISKKGIFLYGEHFNSIVPTFSGCYILMRGKKVGVADSTGKELISTKYEEVQELGNGYFFAKEHGLWGVLNHLGNVAIPFNYACIQFDPEHNRLITMEPGREINIKK